MEALIKMVTDKTGISHEQAATAVTTVISFLKDKLPGGLGEQLDAYVKDGNGSSVGGIADSLKDKMGGLFGK
jgi:uncharacterized protein (DUF2267 family)